MTLLDTIASPADLKRLSIQELESLAGEIRAAIFAAVQQNGGHLASNLGVVELTLALHYVYDFGPHPTGLDKLLFDVGHQCYPHKMLTGRAKGFANLRKQGAIGGFPMPDESAYDLFAVGHAGHRDLDRRWHRAGRSDARREKPRRGADRRRVDRQRRRDGRASTTPGR